MALICSPIVSNMQHFAVDYPRLTDQYVLIGNHPWRGRYELSFAPVEHVPRQFPCHVSLELALARDERRKMAWCWRLREKYCKETSQLTLR